MTTAPRPLPRTSPHAVGMDPSAVDRLVDALDALGATHSVMVLRHGQVVAEQWWHPHSPEQPHMMFSVSKTFVSMAVGIAVGEGLLTVDSRVVDLLPDDAPAAPSENLRAMRVRDLLTMTTGHAADTSGPLTATGWARQILAAPVVHRPGTRFVYNSGATYLLSAILQRLTGQRVLDYLTPRVLAPLGITGATWEQSDDGVDCGGWGLRITTEDMAAFGQLILQRGRWGDAQLVPEAWVDAATTVHADSSPQGFGPESAVGYGYQMWRCTNGSWRADGAFGQYIVVWPEHDVVIAATAGRGAMADMLAIFWETLDGAFGEGSGRAPASDPSLSPSPSPGAGAGRRERALPVPDGDAWTRFAEMIDGRTFAIEASPRDHEEPRASLRTSHRRRRSPSGATVTSSSSTPGSSRAPRPWGAGTCGPSRGRTRTGTSTRSPAPTRGRGSARSRCGSPRSARPSSGPSSWPSRRRGSRRTSGSTRTWRSPRPSSSGERAGRSASERHRASTGLARAERSPGARCSAGSTQGYTRPDRMGIPTAPQTGARDTGGARHAQRTPE